MQHLESTLLEHNIPSPRDSALAKRCIQCLFDCAYEDKLDICTDLEGHIVLDVLTVRPW